MSDTITRLDVLKARRKEFLEKGRTPVRGLSLSEVAEIMEGENPDLVVVDLFRPEIYKYRGTVFDLGIERTQENK